MTDSSLRDDLPRLDRLRHVRQSRSGFDGRFFERHRDFWPIARAAAIFADREDWPEVSEYNSLFGLDAPVRFERAPVKRRRPAGPIVRADLYDAMITVRRIVPTRAAMWHDYLNALVWATFPRAKLALHRRQHAAIQAWIPEGATQLPNARTRELDALALLDEGGVLVVRHHPEGDGVTPRAMLFGHALFEGHVLGQPAMIARSLHLDARGGPRVDLKASAPKGRPSEARAAASVTSADRLLSELLADTTRITSPHELARLPLDA